jgi:hypothetical protein
MTRRPFVVRATGVLVLALSVPAGSALATAGGGGAGIAAQGRGGVSSTPAAAGASQNTPELLPARLDAVDLTKRTVTVRGQLVPLHPDHLKVLGRGGQTLGPAALRAGQTVRLALEPEVTTNLPANANGKAHANANANAGSAAATKGAASASARRIVLIYIDG